MLSSALQRERSQNGYAPDRCITVYIKQAARRAPVSPAIAQTMWSSSLCIFSRRTPTACVSRSCTQSESCTCRAINVHSCQNQMLVCSLRARSQARCDEDSERLCAKKHDSICVRPAILKPGRRTFDMIFFSATSTMPSCAFTPTTTPPFPMASIAYST
jgi:hypothetical protein